MKRLPATLVDDAGSHDLHTFFTHPVAQAARTLAVIFAGLARV